MGLTVHIKHKSYLSSFVHRFPCFNRFIGLRIPNQEKYSWYLSGGGNEPTDIYVAQIMFIGKTGYGKSTTINKIVGEKVLETSDVSACTKDLFSALYRVGYDSNTYLSFSDLPGVGESNYADNHYYTWYKEMFNYSHVVVYVLRADQRDFAVDEILFKNMFNDYRSKRKVILALNCADKIEPINRKNGISEQQKVNLNKKIKEVSSMFGVAEENIVWYSAAEGYNFEELMKKISLKLYENINYNDYL